MTQTMKIKYVSEEIRSTWTSISEISELFTQEEIVEMVNRYQDTQRHAVAYRKKAALTAKTMKERLAQLEALIGDQAPAPVA